MNKTKDLVVIRVWKGNADDVFALFPAYPADVDGRYCTSYQHVGQHSSADYGHCIRNSRPATKAEVRPLLTELRRIGYRPRVLKRAAHCHHDERLSAARGVA